MIYVRLMGGLGNQMFQYAAARSLALHRNTSVTLDLSHYDNPPPGDVPRTFELGCFQLPAKQTHTKILSKGESKSFLKKTFSSQPALYEEKSLTEFDENVSQASDNTLLIGYWQSENYFIDQAEAIRRDFVFVTPLSDQKQVVAEKIRSTRNSVSLQIRRGDFASHPASSQFHGLVPMDYYMNSLAEIKQTIHSPTVFVISDDPEWCKANLKLDAATIFVEHVPGTGWEDMNLMSQCEHHIIANSSFGWWGAWLGANPDKKIIAPKRWFNDDTLDTADLVPAKWIRL